MVPTNLQSAIADGILATASMGSVVFAVINP